MKKKLPLIIILLLVIVGGIALAISKGNKAEPAEEVKEEKKRIVEPTNVIDVSERPYIKINPISDGRNIEIEVVTVKKDATAADYELEYLSGSLLQGAFGQVDLATLPAVEKIFFGSCSAGGACTYHEDVQGGNLLTRFTGGDEKYALKSDWKYIDNKAGETEFSSKDAKFQIDSKDLAKQRFIVIFNTAGFPDGIEGTVVSDPYSLTTSSTLSGEATLTMRANEEGAIMIMGYDGKEWTKFEGEVEGKMITAEVELMELYLVVKN